MTQKVLQYAKFGVALLIPAAQLLQAALTDGTVTGDEWVKIILAVVGAAGVLAIPNAGANKPTPPMATPPMATPPRRL